MRGQWLAGCGGPDAGERLGRRDELGWSPEGRRGGLGTARATAVRAGSRAKAKRWGSGNAYEKLSSIEDMQAGPQNSAILALAPASLVCRVREGLTLGPSPAPSCLFRARTCAPRGPEKVFLQRVSPSTCDPSRLSAAPVPGSERRSVSVGANLAKFGSVGFFLAFPMA